MPVPKTGVLPITPRAMCGGDGVSPSSPCQIFNLVESTSWGPGSGPQPSSSRHRHGADDPDQPSAGRSRRGRALPRLRLPGAGASVSRDRNAPCGACPRGTLTDGSFNGRSHKVAKIAFSAKVGAYWWPVSIASRTAVPLLRRGPQTVAWPVAAARRIRY